MKIESLSTNINTLIKQVEKVHADVEKRMKAGKLQEAETGLMLANDLMRVAERNMKDLEKAEAETLLIEAETEENQELTES